MTLSPAAAAARAEATFSRRRDYAYAYDYRTRRVGRIEGGEANTVVFLGGLSVQEYGREASGARKAQPDVEHIRGSGMAGGVGGLVYSVRGAGAGADPSYNLYNSRGDVVAQTNGTGAFTWQAAYEAFGTRTGESGLNRERHRANTKDEDLTGLLNEGMRYRDLETGVWLTRDPAGFVDGPNLYAYVRQNPWSAFDPHGLYLDVVIEAASIGAGVGSAVHNFRNGNTREAWADVGFAALDVVLVVIPGVPGGTGLARQGIKQGVKKAGNIVDAAGRVQAGIDAQASLNEGDLTGAALNALGTVSSGKNAAKPKKGRADGGAPEGSSAQEIVAKEVTLSRKKYPESVQHLEDTGKVGVELPVFREGTAARRKAATSQLETKPGFDRDESPPAFLRQDGEQASVRHVPSSDNRGAGASLGGQARGADKVIIRVDED